MIDKGYISSLLEDEYPFIRDYLGSLIFQRILLPEPEKCILVHYLVEKENSLDLFDLEQTIMYGEEYCESFKMIFSIDLNNKQNPDWEFTKIFARLRAFEFLSKNKFRQIRWIGDEQNNGVCFDSNRNNMKFALAIKMGSDIDDFLDTLNSTETKYSSLEYLQGELYSALSTHYKNLHNFCLSRISSRGILLISFGKDYLVHKRQKIDKTILPRISAVLNKEWFALKSQGEKYQYLHNIVFLIGNKGRDVIVYPSLKSHNSWN